MTWRGGRRGRHLLIGAMTIAVIGAAAVVVKEVWPNDSARAVDPTDVLERYRAANTTTPGEPSTVVPPSPEPSRALPAPGVYLYRMAGQESVDLLGGATHTYPEQTALTVTLDGCGVLLRWDLLVERRDEWRLCAGDDGIEIPPLAANYHEFFGTGRLEQQVCSGTMLVLPDDGATRAPVQWFCSLGSREWLPEWEVLEPGTLPVEGTPVEVTHVRMTVTDDDHYFEHTVVDWWLDERGLPVAMSASKESRSDSGVIGDVVYREEYRADLLSLTPIT